LFQARIKYCEGRYTDKSLALDYESSVRDFFSRKSPTQEHNPIRIKKKKKGFIPCFMKVNLGCFSIEKTNDSASVVPKKLASKSRENISYLVVYKCSILEIIKKRY